MNFVNFESESVTCGRTNNIGLLNGYISKFIRFPDGAYELSFELYEEDINGCSGYEVLDNAMSIEDVAYQLCSLGGDEDYTYATSLIQFLEGYFNLYGEYVDMDYHFNEYETGKVDFDGIESKGGSGIHSIGYVFSNRVWCKILDTIRDNPVSVMEFVYTMIEEGLYRLYDIPKTGSIEGAYSNFKIVYKVVDGYYMDSLYMVGFNYACNVWL